MRIYNDDKVITKMTDEERKRTLKCFGDKIVELHTYCGEPCYLVSKSEKEHLLWIPSNVTELNKKREANDNWVENNFTPQIEDLTGSLMVVGGEGLKSCVDMFYNCRIEKVDLSGFDTREVEDMSYMFWGCSGLEEINFTYFRTDKVMNMEHMFEDCYAISMLDLSTFVVSPETNVFYMFCGCSEKMKLIANSNVLQEEWTNNFKY